jgi:hypothetical protein
MAVPVEEEDLLDILLSRRKRPAVLSDIDKEEPVTKRHWLLTLLNDSPEQKSEIHTVPLPRYEHPKFTVKPSTGWTLATFPKPTSGFILLIYEDDGSNNPFREDN